MKHLILTIFVFTFSIELYAQNEQEKAVQQTVINMFEALSNRDATALRSYCAPDARFNEYGQAWTVDTLINLAITKNKAVDFKRTNKLEFINTAVKGDVAWTTYNLHSEISSEGKSFVVNWNETAILVRNKKQWLLQVLHSTRIK